MIANLKRKCDRGVWSRRSLASTKLEAPEFAMATGPLIVGDDGLLAIEHCLQGAPLDGVILCADGHKNSGLGEVMPTHQHLRCVLDHLLEHHHPLGVGDTCHTQVRESKKWLAPIKSTVDGAEHRHGEVDRSDHRVGMVRLADGQRHRNRRIRELPGERDPSLGQETQEFVMSLLRSPVSDDHPLTGPTLGTLSARCALAM